MILVCLLILLLIILYTYAAPRTVTREGVSIRFAPDGIPIFGHGIQFLRQRHDLLDWFTKLQRKYGFETLQVSIPTLPAGVIISDPVNIEFVLKNEQLVGKGEFTRTRLDALFKRGIINANGDLWSSQRKSGSKFFSGSQLEVMVEEVLPEAIQRVRTNLNKHINSGAVVDMQNVFLDYTSFIMGHMAYDVSFQIALGRLTSID